MINKTRLININRRHLNLCHQSKKVLKRQPLREQFPRDRPMLSSKESQNCLKK